MALAEVKVLSCLLFRRRARPANERGKRQARCPVFVCCRPASSVVVAPSGPQTAFLSPSVPSPISFFGYGSGEQPAADSSIPRARHRPRRLLLFCYFASAIPHLFFSRPDPPSPDLSPLRGRTAGAGAAGTTLPPMLVASARVVWKSVLRASAMCGYGGANMSPL